MTLERLEQLLREGESSHLDYKAASYPFALADDVAKSELLKDILAFSNAWRAEPAHILTGVKAILGAPAAVAGITVADAVPTGEN